MIFLISKANHIWFLIHIWNGSLGNPLYQTGVERMLSLLIEYSRKANWLRYAVIGLSVRLFTIAIFFSPLFFRCTNQRDQLSGKEYHSSQLQILLFMFQKCKTLFCFNHRWLNLFIIHQMLISLKKEITFEKRY